MHVRVGCAVTRGKNSEVATAGAASPANDARVIVVIVCAFLLRMRWHLGNV
jgi:hypothetical protein